MTGRVDVSLLDGLGDVGACGDVLGVIDVLGVERSHTGSRMGTATA